MSILQRLVKIYQHQKSVNFLELPFVKIDTLLPKTQMFAFI